MKNIKKDISKITEKEKLTALDSVSIKRFENMEELRAELKKYEENSSKDLAFNEESIVQDEAKEASSESRSTDYSKTNNQVESVDEADIVKTDGNYIYYSKNNRVYIVDQDLNLKATIKEKNFCASQIFVNGDKLIVFGSENSIYQTKTVTIDSVMKENISSYNKPKTYARVYNIKDIENPELVREIAVDGYYQDARMIDDDIYFITNYSIYFYKPLEELKDEEILPSFRDSSISEETKSISVDKIAHFEDTTNYQYSLISGFNLNSNDEVNVETFFGFGSELYVSENNMYIICTKYSNLYDLKSYSTIYKFKLENSSIIAVASCEVDGNINNQFSLDEYNGNLRVATTIFHSYYNEENEYMSEYYTRLTIFDENLEKIGGIDNLIDGEKIYAVRFIGTVGYIVTFEQVDPLWVIDLSDPTKPVVKGELEIPGYSSYLHPYDETHIIGIGYDVKSNGYGGVTNDTLKLSMFDVSDLENPKELFKINFNQKNAYSNIMYEHKALFFNKNANLIGFPISTYNYRKNESGILLYRVDLENNKFEEITSLVENVGNYAERSIYIGENIYVLYNNLIVKYDLNTFEKKNSLKLETDYIGDN